VKKRSWRANVCLLSGLVAGMLLGCGGTGGGTASTTSSPVLSVSGQLAVSPASLAFGNVTVGSTKSLTATMTASTASVTVQSAAVSDPAYSITGITFPFTLNPATNPSATYTVNFAPTGAGTVNATITFNTNASNSPITQTLSGTGVAPPPGTTALSPALPGLTGGKDFGSVNAGSSASTTGTLTAVGGRVNISAVAVSPTGAPFSVTLPFPPPFPVLSGQPQTFTVTFSPLSAASSSATITFTSDASNSPTSLNVTGTGFVQLSVALTGGTDFGNVLIGSTASKPGTLSAQGATVHVSAVTTTPAGAPFSVTGLPALPFAVVPGQSQAFNVTFSPTSGGSSSANITFTSDASTPSSLSVKGAGVLQHSVDLSWTASATPGVNYNVYRGVTSGVHPNKLNTNLVACPAAPCAFTDSTVQSGITYFYVVRAVDANNVESVDSNEATAPIPFP